MTDTNLVAVACVVDSSYTLASEWPRILLEYISPLLKRLDEIYAGHQLRIAFVTYATSDMRPSPLLSKRFFAPFAPLTKELRDEPMKLGLGQTANGGRRGMAALEGLVAAVELFDTLRTSTETKPGKPHSVVQSPPNLSPHHICHVIHVAASPADSAQRPLWNDSPSLDGVTWESLPGEFRKRNINLNMINLRHLPRFAELHSLVAAGAAQPPWFNVRSPNTILLTGFLQQKLSNPAPTMASTLKRAGDVHTRERTPDTKRPKTQPSPSPEHTNVTPPSQTHNQTQPLQPQPLPHPQPQPQPPQLAQTPARPSQITTQQQIIERLRNTETQIQRMDGAINNAKALGNTQLAENLIREKNAKLLAHQKFKAAIAAFAQNHQMALARSGVQDAENLGTGVSGISNTLTPSNHPTSSSPNKDLKPPQQFVSEINGSNQAVPGHDSQLTQNGTVGSTFPPLPNNNLNPVPTSVPPNGLQTSQVPPNVSPQAAAQMQKLFDQQRSRPPYSGGGQPQPHSDQQQTGDHSRSPPVWHGVLTWTGFHAGTQDRKEVHAQVVAHLQPGGSTDSRSETWPSTLTLTPARDPAVSTQELHLWMKRHKPVLCTFQAQARSVDLMTNEGHYRSLVQLLMAKNVYAVAAWTLPSGSHDNILVFPVNGIGLGAAVFPVTGIPELPKGIPLTLPPKIVAQLQKLNPGQRNVIITQMMRQRQQQLQSQQQQQQQQQQESSNTGTLPFNLGGPQAPSGLYPNMGMNGLGGLGDQQQLSAAMQGVTNTGLQRSLSGGMQSGGMGAVITNEMLQSFRKRNT